MSISLSPLSVVSFSSFGVVVERLGWEASSRSILLWVADSSVPLKCRVGSAPSNQVAGLVAMLRLSRRRGWKINLGVRKGWDNGQWFCAAEWTSWAKPRRRLPEGLAAGLAAIHARSISKRYADAE